MRILLLFLLVNCFSFGQTDNTLSKEFSMFVYNNSKDTIHLSEIGEIDYFYCDSSDHIIDTSDFSNPFPKFSAITPESVNDFRIWPTFNIYCDSLSIIDSIQLDGLGAKEIVFYRSFYIMTNDGGGTWSSSATFNVHKIDIWNIDTKKLLLDRVIYYDKHQCNSQIDMGVTSCNETAFDLIFELEETGNIRFIDNNGYYHKWYSFSNYPAAVILTPTQERSSYRETEITYNKCSWLQSILYEFSEGEYKVVKESGIIIPITKP